MTIKINDINYLYYSPLMTVSPSSRGQYTLIENVGGYFINKIIGLRLERLSQTEAESIENLTGVFDFNLSDNIIKSGIINQVEIIQLGDENYQAIISLFEVQ